MGAAAAVFGSTPSRMLLAAAAGARRQPGLGAHLGLGRHAAGPGPAGALIRSVSPGPRRGSGWPSAPHGSALRRGGSSSACISTAACSRRSPRWRWRCWRWRWARTWRWPAPPSRAGKAAAIGARDALFFALLWLLAELARARLFTGFPWGASGYTQIDGPLAALAPWIGVYGIGFVVALIAALVVLMHGALWKRVLPLSGCWWSRRWLRATSPCPRRHAARVAASDQRAAEREVRCPPREGQPARACRRTIAAAKGTLVVAPETAIPLLPQDLGARGLRRLSKRRSATASAAHWSVCRWATSSAATRIRSLVLAANAAARRCAALPLRQAPPRPLRRIHPLGLSLVREHDAHPAGRLRARAAGGAVVHAVAGERVGAEHLLRRSLRRRTRAALRPRRRRADDLRQRQQHRVVRRHDRDRPAPEHLAHAHPRVAAPDDPRHQHRRHRRHRPHRPRHRAIAAADEAACSKARSRAARASRPTRNGSLRAAACGRWRWRRRCWRR